MIITLAGSTPPEVESINTQEGIKYKRRNALRHESNNLSTGHASRHTPNVLYPGHTSQQEPIRSDTETVPEGHASQDPPNKPKKTNPEQKKEER